MQQPRYVHYTLSFPLAIQFSVMALHCQTWPWGRAIYSHPWLILQYIIQKCFILSMFQKTHILQWRTEHIFPAHWVGLKAIFHATVSTEPFPKALNSYLIFLIPPLILLCFYFSKHDMKATFLYSFTFESAIFQSSDVNRITLYHLQLNVSAQQMWNTSSVSLLSLKPAT